MSNADPIDLSIKAQVFFDSKVDNFTFFSAKCFFRAKSFVRIDDYLINKFENVKPPAINVSFNEEVLEVKLIQFLKIKRMDAYSPFFVIVKPKLEKNELVYLNYYYFSLYPPSIEFVLLPNSIFNTQDKNKSNLNYQMSYEFLIDKKPYLLFGIKEWVVGWLLIFELTAKQISELTDITISYVEKLSKIIFEKTRTYNKNLYSRVTRSLGWGRYIPSSFIKDNYLIIGTVYKTSPTDGLT